MREPFARSAVWRAWFDQERGTRRNNLLLLWKIGAIRWTDIMVCYRASEIMRQETDWLFLEIRAYADSMTGLPSADLPEADAYWRYRACKYEICPDCQELREVGEICSELGGSVHFKVRQVHWSKEELGDVSDVREGCR